MSRPSRPPSRKAIPALQRCPRGEALAKAVRENADIESIVTLMQGTDGNTRTNAFLRAVREHRTPLVQAMLPHVVHQPATLRDGLVMAARLGHADLLPILVQLTGEDLSQSRALSQAAERGHLSVVEWLLPRSNPLFDDGAALVGAARGGHLDVVGRLMACMEPSQANPEALGAAAEAGHLDVVVFLLNHLPPAFEHCKALRLAARAGRLDVLDALLPVSDAMSMDGHALWGAARGRHEEVMRRLLPLSSVSTMVDGVWRHGHHQRSVVEATLADLAQVMTPAERRELHESCQRNHLRVTGLDALMVRDELREALGEASLGRERSKRL